MNNKDLALQLASAETEDRVIEILKNETLWDDMSCWRPYGDNENNFSIIGNQQSNPDAALVEKLINSVDAILMKECALRSINPESADAPQSMSEALKKFYQIDHGKIMMMDTRNRNEMSKNIILAATGKQRGEENLVIVDKGEGQTPNAMPKTILSISRSNKQKIPFVQGKFNMGGTGALPFCGKNHMELIISKRCHDIADRNEPRSSEWSITLVRKEPAREGRKSSMYTYLTDRHGKILSFEAPLLPIIPETEEKPKQDMEYGTFIKLFNYDMKGYKTNIIMDFNRRLSLLVPELAHPIRIRECRPGFNGHTLALTLSGITTRLNNITEDEADVDNDHSIKIEKGFPSYESFVIDGQNMECSIYLFKKGKQEKYRGKHEGILFTVNGQTQGIMLDSFFTGNKLNLSYIKDSILMIVDCSKLDIPHQEDLFMTSRDRIRNSEFSKKLEEKLTEILKGHRGLKDAEQKRRMESLKDKISDNKPLKDVLENILKKSAVLTKLFITGTAISSPISGKTQNDNAGTFNGKKHPTFFKLTGKIKDGRLVKRIPINHSFRVQFETDVQNDYFGRIVDAGDLVLKMGGEVRNDLKQSLNLFNGIATLTISMPEDAKVGIRYQFETEINDSCIFETFPNSFEMIVEEPQEYSQTGNSTGRTERHNNIGKNTQSGFAMPEMIPVHKDEWEKYDMNEQSALKYFSTETGGDYFLNMDNTYLLNELNSTKDENKRELTRSRYTYSMTLIAMSVVGYYKNRQEKDEDVDINGQVEAITKMVSPVLIPMLEAMADLDISNQAN